MLIWDEEKNKKLFEKRGISFEEIAEKIIQGDIIDILKNPARDNQKIFIVSLNDYIYAVPFLLDKNENIILKTAYPSRKLHQRYQKRKNE